MGRRYSTDERTQWSDKETRLIFLSPPQNSNNCNRQGKGGTTRTRARTLPNPEALGPEIEEGAVNRRPLQALFLLPRGGARPATGPGAIYLQSTYYLVGVSKPKISRMLAVAIRCSIGRGELTIQRRETLTVASFPPLDSAIPLSGTSGRRHWRRNYQRWGGPQRRNH